MSVQEQPEEYANVDTSHFNTSYVSVQVEEDSYAQIGSGFQYILCVGSS